MLNSVGKGNVARRLTIFNLLLAAFCMIVLLSSPGTVNAQIYYGTITGTVTDTTGAVVSGATVNLKNVGTAATYTATSDSSGNYTFAQLPIGIYELRVKQTGFKEFVSTGVEVHTSTHTVVDAQLQLGAATETVTVEASDVQVQTVTASAGEVVEGQQVRELPLNGENFMGLVVLSPGVSPDTIFNSRDKGLTGGSDFSVDGNSTQHNLFLIDGVNNNDVGSGRTILVYPSVDAIAEFKMIRNSYAPEYGQAAGAIISITTKSGENTFHGGLFYAGRNDALDANDWFSNRNQTGKAELRRNDWGYNFSGPVIKNKLFFWWNQEWNREVRGISDAYCVPTVAEKNGDFSAYAGATADQCGGAIPKIPVASQVGGNPLIEKVDPVAQLLTSIYPNPTTANNGLSLISGNNWLQSVRVTPDWSEWNVRGDYDINTKNRVTFRWTNDSWTSPGPNAPGQFWGDVPWPTINSNWSQPSKSVMAKLTTQIGNTMVNDFEFGYGHNAIDTSLTSTAAPIVKAINAAIPSAWPTSLKTLPAYPLIGWGGLAPYGAGNNLWTIAPYANHEDLYALQDNLSKVQGNHVWKVGAYYSTNAKIENNNGGTDQPNINPASYAVGTDTGSQLGNLLLAGQTFNTSETSINQTARVIWHDFEWYIGDTWKVRRNVTLTYGFRWSFYRQPYGETNQWGSFSLADWSASEAAANPSDACNGVVIVPGTNPCGQAASQLAALGISLPLSGGTPGPNRALTQQNNHDIAPRIGIAWDIFGDGKMALRLGVGQFYQRDSVGASEGLAGTAPFVISATDNHRTLEAAVPLVSPAVSPTWGVDPHLLTPNSWQWNISLERQLARNTVLQVGYVGNAGMHLRQGLDMNAPPYADWGTTAFLNTSSFTNINTYRPASNFSSISQMNNGGHSSYHSLQALFRARTGNFSTFQAAYTWSHTIANTELNQSSNNLSEQGVTDQADTRLDRGNARINRPQIFVANEVFYLPKLANKSTFVRGALGSWEANSIITISSGNSQTVFAGAVNDANQCVNAMLIPGAPAGVPCSGAGSNANDYYVLSTLMGSNFPSNANSRPDAVVGVKCNSNQSGNQIWNPAAFTWVGYQIGTVGNSGRGTCLGPDTRNIDFQLAKNWYFKERFRLKFSMDFFNLFNNVNFKGNSMNGTFNANNVVCGTSACSPANKVITGETTNPNQSFGQATVVQPGRELQYTLRFSF